MNVLSMHALVAAYSPEGSEWADELCAVLAGNIDFACNYIKTRFDGVEVTKPEGTYILFADCTKWCEAHGKTIDDVERACWDVGVAVQDGRQFHGPCHIRMNLALLSPACRRPSTGWTNTFSTHNASNETHSVGLSFERLRLAAAHSLCAEGAQLARLRAEKYFCRCACHRQKCFKLPLRLRAQTLRGFFDRKEPMAFAIGSFFQNEVCLKCQHHSRLWGLFFTGGV